MFQELWGLTYDSSEESGNAGIYGIFFPRSHETGKWTGQWKAENGAMPVLFELGGWLPAGLRCLQMFIFIAVHNHPEIDTRMAIYILYIDAMSYDKIAYHIV